MKVSFRRTQQKDVNARQVGFSVIEILVASAFALMIIPAVFAATLGTQSAVVGGETNNEATAKAQQMLENAQSLARQDFSLVNATTSTEKSGALTYTKQTMVTTLPDFVTKQVTSIVSWLGDHGQQLKVTLTTLVTNLENVHAPNTCNSVLSGDWKHPQRLDYDFGQLANNGNNANGFDIADVEVQAGKLYAVVDDVPNTFKSTIFIFDLSDPKIPALLGNIDNAKTVTPGLSAVTIASTTNSRYAFFANANGANFKTCAQGSACSQLQVYNVLDSSLPPNVASTSIRISPNAPSYTWGSGGDAVGKSIFYKDGYLYLGLTTTTNGPAFHVFNVSTPMSPVWVGSWPAPSSSFGSSGAPINSIFVKGDYAYITHPNGLVGATSEQLTVLDIHDPAHPVRVSGFSSAAGVGGNGKSVVPVGSKLYFGRTASNISGSVDILPELFVLDNTTPTSIPSTALGSKALATADSANGIVIRDSLEFVVTNTQFQVWNISDPQHIYPWTQNSLMSEFLALPSGSGVATDCEGNYFYVGSHSSQGQSKDIISVIYPGP